MSLRVTMPGSTGRDLMEKSVREKIAAGDYKNELPYSDPYNPDIRAYYRAEDGRLRNVFQRDLEIENGVVGHPKANRLFELAWEHGHSSGYSDVVNYYEDFVELIK